jgi:putative NADH-flavin reductase
MNPETQHIALFGGTGRTGSRVLALALDRGWGVNAMARNPEKLTLTHPGLTVIKGELSDEEALARTLEGAHAAVIALGTGTDLQTTHVLSEGTAQIVRAVQKTAIKRVVCLLSGWLFYAAPPPQFVPITQDHERQRAILAASGLDWVAACPPALIDRPAQHRYKLAFGRMPGDGYLEIGIDDLAEFLLDATRDPSYVRQSIGIAD